jgi:hypothetical protein
MSFNSILSAEIIFDKGEQAVREFAAILGIIVQYLPPHFTLVYGWEALLEESKKFLETFQDPQHPVYLEKPKPIGFAIFHVKDKGYNAVAVKYEWPEGRCINKEVTNNAILFPKGPTFGFNGDKFTAHVTIAYVSLETELTPEIVLAALEEKNLDLSLFDLTIDKITSETSVKRHKVEVKA